MKKYHLLLLLIFIYFSCKKNETEPSTQNFATGLLESTNLSGYSYADIPTSGPIPTSFDLSAKMPTVQNQLNQSSCVAFASMYVKSYHEYVEKGLTQYTESDIMSPSFIYNQTNAYKIRNNGVGCQNSGSFFDDVLNFLKNNGVCSISDMSYNENDCSTLPNQNTINKAKLNKITSFRRVNMSNNSDVKTLIYTGSPILIGVETDNNFHNASLLTNGKYIWKGNNSKKTGLHALVIVGYDDNIQAFKIINSWGNNWGNNGYAWIAYDYIATSVKEAWVTIDERNTNNTDITISLLPTSVDFGSVQIGSSSTPKTITIKNIGTKELTINGISFPLEFKGSNWSGNLKANEIHNIDVVFTPPASGNFSKTIAIDANSTVGSKVVSVMGIGTGGGTNGVLTLSSDIDFSNVIKNQTITKQLTITNTGNAPISITNLTTSLSSIYTLMGFTLPISLGVGEAKTINVNMNTTSTGSFPATITVISSVGNKSINVVGTVIDAVSSTLTDTRDNETYKIVTFVGKTWMAENLRYKVPTTGDDVPWNNDNTKLLLHGRYYRWAVIMNGGNSSDNNPSGVQGICPTGWHIPSRAEWQTLLTYYGNDQNLTYSSITNGGESKINLLLSGYNDGTWYGQNARGCYWTAYDNYGLLLNVLDPVRFTTFASSDRLPCRCVKD